MKKYPQLVFAALLAGVFFVNDSLACTTFCLKNKSETLFGRNYDWMVGDGLVLVNKRGVAKRSTTETDNPAQWASRYGSVTFNQYGRENPMGGMNEAGLVVELMWLDETRYPTTGKLPTVDVLEWVQYQLDTAATVEEALKNAENLRIVSRVTLHYLVSDKNGNAATVEFLNGGLVAHTGERLAVAALANDTYEKSLAYAKTATSTTSQSSFDRFTRAAARTKNFAAQTLDEQRSVAYAFDTLADVAQGSYTQWSIVYDQQRGRIHFRTLKSAAVKTIDARGFDYACGTPVKIFDVNAREAGDVTAKFTDYTSKANRELIERSFGGTDFLKAVPPAARDAIAAYPDSFACAGATKAETAAPVKPEEAPGVFAYFQTLYRFFFGA